MNRTSIAFLATFLSAAASTVAWADFDVTKSITITPPKNPNPYSWDASWYNGGTNTAKERDVTDNKTKDGSVGIKNPPPGKFEVLVATVGATEAKTVYSLPKIFGSRTQFDATVNVKGTTRLGAKENVPSAEISAASSELKIDGGIRVFDQKAKKWELKNQVTGTLETDKDQKNAVVADPISVRFLDYTTGDTYESKLFSWDLSLGPGNNIATMDDAGLLINADVASFKVSMPGEWTSTSGWAKVEIVGGKVVKSEGEGIYADKLPALGETGPIRLDMTNANLELDNSKLPNMDGHMVDMQTSIGVGGSDQKSAVPEPASMVTLALGLGGLLSRRVKRSSQIA